MHSRQLVFTIFALHTWIIDSAVSVNFLGSHVNDSSVALNATALALFEQSRLSYERLYDDYGRVPSEVKLPSDVLSLDFEIETFGAIQMSPELLLQRGGVDLFSESREQTSYGHQEVSHERSDNHAQTWISRTSWPKVSEYFTLGIDGLGRKTKNAKGHTQYRQKCSAQIEIETRLLRPSEVVHSSFTTELQSVLSRLHDASGNTRRWVSLPFPGAQGIRTHGAINSTKPCRGCEVQFTVGIVLAKVPALLEMAHARAPLRNITRIVDEICRRRETGCAPEYRALVSLAAWNLVGLRRCMSCTHPKRCMTPWLVRTHFGDMVMYLKDALGANAVDHLPSDVLEAAEAKRDDPVLPYGVVDYLRLPEMAEINGLVYPRVREHQLKHLITNETEDMPVTPDGLLQLARHMLRHRKPIDNLLSERPCGIHGRKDVLVSNFTTESWLRGLLRGKDLMSDHDSPLTESSFSHLLWKSMGKWRMKPRSDRVYLECRQANDCLGLPNTAGPAALITAVGKKMKKFEERILEEKKANSTQAHNKNRRKMRRNKAARMVHIEQQQQSKGRLDTEIHPSGHVVRVNRTQYPRALAKSHDKRSKRDTRAHFFWSS